MLGKYGLLFDDVAGAPGSNDKQLLEQVSDPAKRVYESVTGEIRWDLKQGLLTVNTPRTRGVVGFTQGQPVALADATVSIDNEFGVVVLSALEGKSLQEARRILVSTSARARWSGMEFDEQRGTITKSGRPPFLMEPVTGRYVLLWFTTVVPVEDGHRVEIAEFRVLGY